MDGQVPTPHPLQAWWPTWRQSSRSCSGPRTPRRAPWSRACATCGAWGCWAGRARSASALAPTRAYLPARRSSRPVCHPSRPSAPLRPLAQPTAPTHPAPPPQLRGRAGQVPPVPARRRLLAAQVAAGRLPGGCRGAVVQPLVGGARGGPGPCRRCCSRRCWSTSRRVWVQAGCQGLAESAGAYAGQPGERPPSPRRVRRPTRPPGCRGTTLTPRARWWRLRAASLPGAGRGEGCAVRRQVPRQHRSLSLRSCARPAAALVTRCHIVPLPPRPAGTPRPPPAWATSWRWGGVGWGGVRWMGWGGVGWGGDCGWAAHGNACGGAAAPYRAPACLPPRHAPRPPCERTPTR